MHVSVPTFETRELLGHKGAVLCLTFTIDGSFLLTGGQDRCPRLWNPRSGTLIHSFSGAHGYDVLDVQVTRDKNKVASAGVDKQVFVWDVGTGTVSRRLRGHEGVWGLGLGEWNRG